VSSLRLDGGSADDSPPVGGADSNAAFWLGAANGGLPHAKNLGALGTGLVINTGGTPSIASLVGLTLVGGVLTATPGEILTGTANEIVKTGTVLSLSPVVTGGIAANTAAIAALQAINLIAGAGLTGGGDHSGPDRTFNIGQNADNSITVNANDIQLSTTLQTAISTNTNNISTLTTTVSGHTTTLGLLAAPKYIVQQPSADLTNEQALSALATGIVKSTTTTGVLSIAVASDLPSLLTTKGDLSVYSTTPARLAVGSNGKVLTADSTATEGVSWQTPAAGGANALGTYIVQTSTNAPANAQILASLSTGIVKSTTTTGVLSIAVAADIPSVLTTKGDIATFSTVPSRLAVGTDGFVLTADAASANGVKWAAGGSSGYTMIDANGTPLTARAILNFSAEFGAVDNSGATRTDITLATAGVAFAKIANGSGNSVLGVAASSAGVMAPIVAGTDGHVLRLSGTTLGFGTLAAGAFAVSTIAGTVLTGFTNTALPIGNSSGQLVDSTLRLASNVLTHAASSSGGTVGLTISNTNAAASSATNLTLLVADPAAGNPSLSLGITGGLTWNVQVTNATHDRFDVLKGSTRMFTIDPSAASGIGEFYFDPAGAGTNAICFSDANALAPNASGVIISASPLGTNGRLQLTGDVLGTAGKGVSLYMWTGGTYKDGVTVDNRTGDPETSLCRSGGNVVVGGATSPTSLAKGITMANGTAPSAAPTNAVSHWAAAAQQHFMGGDGVDIVL